MGGVRVLLVEDEMLIRELAAEDFTDAGFEVVAATSGDEALFLLEAGRDFDLLFTDIRMPGEVDGIDLARRARSLLPTLRVIYATGYDDKLRDLTPDERCIRKPYAFSEVLGLVASLGLTSS
jgi:CheY-like chemotaxis protein